MADPRTSLARFIRWVMRDTVYLRVTTATVVVPSIGDTVDLMPDDPDFSGSGLQGVPVWYGLPSVKATISPGAKMLLIFEGGDPSKPRAICFSGDGILLTMMGGVSPVARVGDTITLTSVIVTGLANPGALTVTGTAIGTGTIVSGNPQVLA